MKPITITEELKQKLIEEFAAHVASSNLSDGKISFSKSFTFETQDIEKAKIVYTPAAWVKQSALLKHFEKEVAWHGRVARNGNVFTIYDIIVYPQEVTGSTVNTDQEKYQKWYVEQLMNDVTDITMQAHSHVRMSVSPSPTDLTHQSKIVSQLRDDSYYIFLIWNKRYECTKKIYDYANNILYEDKDIDIEIDSEVDLEAFLSEADSLVSEKKYTYTTPSASTYSGSYDSYGSTMGFDDDYYDIKSGEVNKSGSFFINDIDDIDDFDFEYDSKESDSKTIGFSSYSGKHKKGRYRR